MHDQLAIELAIDIAIVEFVQRLVLICCGGMCACLYSRRTKTVEDGRG